MRLNLDQLSGDERAALGEELRFVPRREALLADYKEGDVVSVGDGTAVVTGVMTDDFEFPTGKNDDGEAQTEKIEASSDSPVYIVATEDGVVAVSEDEVSDGSFDTEKGSSVEDVKELADRSESASVYEYMSNPSGSVEELEEARRALLADRYSEELADAGITDVSASSVEELLNIPGVDDPGVGFSSMPNGWTRKSVLQAWASLGGSFTTCVTQMTGDIRSPKRFCAALKDETLGTELWRGRF